MLEKEQDFYCDEVLSGNTPVEKVMETEHSLAFHHTRPFYKHHIVVIPKKHIRSLVEIEEADAEVFRDLMETIRKVATQMNDEFGACTVSTNIGVYQSNKHMHWHIHFGDRIRDLDGTWC